MDHTTVTIDIFINTDLFLSKVTTRVHGGDQSEFLPGDDELNVIIISASFLCQH